MSSDATVPPGASGTTAHARQSWPRLWRKIITSESWAVLQWWYFALLLISIVAKYFGTGWGDLGTEALVDKSGFINGLAYIAHVFHGVFRVYRADLIEIWLLILLLVLLGHVVARIPLRILSWISISVAGLVAFAGWIAQEQTGVPLTYSTLVISLQWASQHPEVIRTVLPVSQIILVVLAAVLYGGIPTLAASSFTRKRWLAPLVPKLTFFLTVSAGVLLVTALVTPGRRLPSFAQTTSPAEGFWGSTIVALIDADRESPANLGHPSRAEVLTTYRRTAYPLGRQFSPHLIAGVAEKQTARHVVLIILETAPREFYRLITDTSYKTFRAMSDHAIVTKHHMTTRPYTLFAIYSILTGTYPRQGTPIGEFGSFSNDGLAATLGGRGYETTYIDSYRVDWGYHYRSELERHGMQLIVDTAGFVKPQTDDPFEVAVARERWSLNLALKSITDAESHKKKALVVVATTLGHFPWRAPANMSASPAATKLHSIAMALDTLTGEFLRGLDDMHLRDSTLVVVTGDHGLRYAAEFASFGYTNRPGNLDFNVPFLLYAPGVIDSRLELPYATSHVDIAPTIYYLLGIPTDSLLLHGENMLDTRLADRATFLMNTGIYPLDGFAFKTHRFGVNTITRKVQVAPPLMGDESRLFGLSDQRVRELLDSANHVFNLTAAQFLTRDEARLAGKR